MKATIVRDGQRKDVEITPTARAIDGRIAGLVNGDRIRERLGDLGALTDRLPSLDFDVRSQVGASGGRLGATTGELTSQLAQYFGTKEGVLVTAVTDDSPAARAGLKAGDVITSVNGTAVRSRADLRRGLSRDGDLTLGLVRDRKETTVVITSR